MCVTFSDLMNNLFSRSDLPRFLLFFFSITISRRLICIPHFLLFPLYYGTIREFDCEGKFEKGKARGSLYAFPRQLEGNLFETDGGLIKTDNPVIY